MLLIYCMTYLGIQLWLLSASRTRYTSACVTNPLRLKPERAGTEADGRGFNYCPSVLYPKALRKYRLDR